MNDRNNFLSILSLHYIHAQILDMFGSSLPVCAVRFPTITELVHHGHNGMIFNSASELTEQIIELLFPNILTYMREVSSTPRNNTNERTDKVEYDVHTVSNALISSENIALGTLDKVASFNSNTTDHINHNHSHNHSHNHNHSHSQISLSALKLGAADIGSWDDNWKSVLAPQIKSWI